MSHRLVAAFTPFEDVTDPRMERREYFVMPAPEDLPGFPEWSKPTTIGMVVRVTQIGENETGEVSCFLSSRAPKIKDFAKLVRGHWGIESQLHSVFDVTFSEDASRIRKQQAPQTSAVLRRLAVSIIAVDTRIKDDIRGKRHRASLSTDVLEQILLSFVQN
jgi:predicted transposase YbfD/YdcC